MPLAILHDVGYSRTENKNPDTKDANQKIIHMRDGAKIARKILEELDFDPELTERVVYLISVHDNWVVGDNKPYKENKDLAAFTDLDFLYAQSSIMVLKSQGKAMGRSAIEMLHLWEHDDEKFTNRPFVTQYAKDLFMKQIADRKKELGL